MLIRSRYLDRKIHTFRAVTDDHFVHRDTMKRLLDGTLARQFKERDLSIIIGEVDKEVSGRGVGDASGLDEMLTVYPCTLPGTTLQLHQPTRQFCRTRHSTPKLLQNFSGSEDP